MKKTKIAALFMCSALVFSCGNNTGNGALIGTGGGAVLGAIVGKIAGNTAVGAAVGATVGAGTGALIGKHMDKVKAEAQKELENAKVEEVTDANGLKAVKLTFDSGILFQTNKYDLNAASKANLNELAALMNKYNTCSVDIYGYTDNTGSDAINNPLSVNRANAVANYLRSQHVANTQMKKIEGLGSSNPVADNSTVEGRKQNRRVEVFMYASEEMINQANNGTLQ